MYEFNINLIILVATFIALASCDATINYTGDSLNEAEKELSNYLQTIEDTPSLPIVGDFVVLEKSELVSREEAKTHEDLIERCVKFLTNRELKIKLPNHEARELLSEARGKKKRIRRIILPILLLLKLKAAIILPIILSIIALVAFKGFGLSLAALAVAGTTALKNILEHVGSKVSYEVVPTSVGHWSRAGAVDGAATGAYHYE